MLHALNSYFQNVLSCGSSLVSKKRDNTWTSMSNDNKRNVAASLVKSIEQVTTNMVHAFNEPANEVIVEENMRKLLFYLALKFFKRIVLNNGL